MKVVCRRRRVDGRRLSMAVWEFRVFAGGNVYGVCPRCARTLDREFVRCCGSCGQALDWRRYGKSPGGK